MGPVTPERVSRLAAAVGAVIVAVAGAIAAAIAFFVWTTSRRQPGFRRVEGIDVLEFALLTAVYAVVGLAVGVTVAAIIAASGARLRRGAALGIFGVVLLACGAALVGWAYSVFVVAAPGQVQPGAGLFFGSLAANGLGGAAGAVGLAGILVAVTARRQAIQGRLE